MHHVHIPILPWTEQRSPGGKFHSFGRNISLALGGQRNVGTWGGGHPFDVQIRRVPPGASVCPYHAHLAQWEFFLVLAGDGRVRVSDGDHSVSAGMAYVHPPGVAHQLTNPGRSDLEVLIVADNPQLDAFYYPDSHKWGLRPPGRYFQMREVDYFHGEDPAGDQVPRETSAPLPDFAGPEFAARCISVSALAWEEWHSPKGSFRGESKELSIALGAKRNTPTGLGGHPFDVEFGKLMPGEKGCPFHSHAAQWELFWIVEGTADVRADDARHTLRAGDVVLHPPGEAHQITNRSDSEDLLYYLVADNPPADYWHYPDSKKWGLRAPRMFFRPHEVDYFDGEE